MANYASLWTSSSDKEFRQMSKAHSLHRRRLGLQMAGLRREHARHVKRVRVQMREAGTLVSQYEDEKERRARHLIRTFSKVQRKQRAAQDWRLAYQQRRASHPSPSSPAPHVQIRTPDPSTFQVEIGSQGAPWGGGRRRDSQQSTSSWSSRRKSSAASFTGNAVSLPRLSFGGIFGGGKASSSSDQSRRRSSGLLSPFTNLPRVKWAGELQQQDASHSMSVPSLVKKWKTVLTRRKQSDSEAASNTNADDGDDDEEEKSPRSELALSTEPGVAASGRRKRQVFWTETFPYVYHSVGEAVCPRYKLFLQYDEYKVQQKDGRRESYLSETSPRAGSRPSLRSVGRSLVAMATLTSTLPRLSLADSAAD